MSDQLDTGGFRGMSDEAWLTLRPPGALLSYMIANWTPRDISELIAETGVDDLRFQKLLVGAVPFDGRLTSIAARATGLGEEIFAQMESDFSRWCELVSQNSEYIDPEMRRHIGGEISFSGAEISRRVASMAIEMRGTISDDTYLVTILKGAFILAADLVRYLFGLRINPELGFVQIRSYPRGEKQARGIELVTRLDNNAIDGREVLFLDDVCDTGETLAFAMERALEAGASSVRSCVLIDKRSRRSPSHRNLKPEFTGFTLSKGWIAGYGMDNADETFRGSPDIFVAPEDAARP